MEGPNIINKAPATEERVVSPDREEKMGEAAKSVTEKFNKSLAEVLQRMGENPYFRDHQQPFV